ncbi:MAG: polyhydroxyalkanoic acid system family protein [Burkholderiaceae bacterium]
MFELRLKRKHKLGLKKGKAAAQQVAEELEREFDMVNEWDGHTLRFSRIGVAGSLVVTRDWVEMQARLAGLLKAFRPRIEMRMQDYLDRYFG